MALTARLTDRQKPDVKLSISVSDDSPHEANIAVHEILEDLLSDCSIYIYDSYLLEKSTPFSVSQVTSWLFSLVESSYIRHEVVETEWEIDGSEPVPCEIDAWARSFVPIKLKYKMIEAEPSKQPHDTRSISSIRSRRTGLSKKKTGIKSFNIAESIQESQTPVKTLEVNIEIDENIEYFRKKKEKENKRKRDNLELKKTIAEEDQKIEKMIEKESKKIKNQKLTYDYKGNVLFVNNFEFEEKFDTHPVKYIPEAVDDPGDKPENKTKTSKVKKEEVEKQWVKNFIIKNSPLIDNINLSPNVTYIEGNHKKHGNNHGEHRTMTRNQYFSKKPQLNNTNFDRKSSLSTFNSVKKDPSKSFFETLPDYEDVLPSQKSSNSISPIKDLSHDKVLKYNSHKGLGSLTNAEQFSLDMMKNPSWGANPPFKKPLIAALVPHKPNIKETLQLHGNIVKKPKDLPFITHEELWANKSEFIKRPKDRPYIDKAIKRKKNPAPSLGKTMFNLA